MNIHMLRAIMMAAQFGPAPKRPSAPAVEGETFHEHLDRCQRCRHQPFDLCQVGKTLIESAPKTDLSDRDKV